MPPPAGGTTSVQVAVRIRPTTSQDTVTIPARFQRTVIQASSATSVQVDATQSAPVPAAVNGIPASSAGPTKKQSFTFDQVHQPTTSQHAMFQTTAEPLISRFLQGFNCTILAYGQTSSGKTYTMTGIDLDADPSDPHNGMGIIPRAVSKIFQRAREAKDERAGAWTYSVKGSFIEIYNEDLIDLLGDENAKREVLIREDKDGNIIWGGLREVGVRNVAEVMRLLLQGTAIRRTNETDMNAQSSRSHAIFSLTLTQKKYTGSGAPPRSSSPIGRPSSRLARPGSLYNSGGQPPVSSPTSSGRPPTPSFHSAMGRGSGLRPGSALGGRISPAPGAGRDDDDVGEWVTIVSKFHFVDLAGSERLKRTGGAGERIKEGISINSGLLALGNVISALGDPARVKSHTASHVPYRDSKLTRLLQDSLGGNAHTLMIACVSPAEWNVGETVNTLKYANRARNIRNRAVVNEKEDGWDDIEWLQNMVTRLRKELKNIKEGSATTSSPSGSAVLEPELDNPSRMVMQQFVELQSQHNNLRQQFTQRTEELTRLRGELGERQRASGGTIAGTAKYEEIVGPVIEEYEKTIAAMEAELSLNRVALRHTNDLVTEKEEELAVVKDRHIATELYLEELRARVAKLTDRESSTEAYIRDLEEKVKAYDEKNVSSTSSAFELKREIQQYRENESRSAQYISDVEQRLSRSDENVLALREQVQRLEYEVEERVQSAELLQQRLNELTADSQGWRSDLEEREARLRELEKQLEVAEETKRLAGEELDRLGNVAGGVARARRSLEADLASAEKAALPSDSDSDVNVKEQLATLQQTHQATLADLDVVTNKYRDALREISDLGVQIQEAKLHSAIASEASEEAHEPSVPKVPRRRMTAGGGSLRSPRSEAGLGQVNGSGRRPFFRQAASTESLHARSLSQSPSHSQELSSPRSHRPSSSGMSRPESVGSSSLLTPPLPRPNLSVQMPESAGGGGGGERSVASLEKEIMRLQEVLKEREAEISSLEQNLQEKASSSSSTLQAAANGMSPKVVSDVEDGDKDIDIDKVKNLSPKTLKQFKDLRRISRRMSLQISGPAATESMVDTSDTLDRLNELMLSMAQKESQHRDIVDGLNAELVQIRRQHDELSALSRDQALNMSTELEALRKEHIQTASELDELRLKDAQTSAELEDQKAANADITSAIEDLRAREATLLNELRSAEEAHASEITRLLAEHERAVLDKEAKFDVLVGEAKGAHEAAIQDLRAEIADGAALLARTRAEHEDAFAKLRADHVLELERRSREVEEYLGQSQSDQAESLAKLQAEHSRALRQEIEDANTRLQNVLEEHAADLEKERSQHAEIIRQRDEDAASTLERLREEHARVLRAAERARETAIAESQASHAAAIRSLREEHATLIDLKEQTYREVIDKGFQERELLRENMEQKHEEALEDLHADHTAALARLEEEKAADISRLTDALNKSRDEYSATLSKHSRDLDAAVQNAREQHDFVVEEMELKHQNALDSVKAQHETALAHAMSTHTEEQAVAMKSVAEATAKLRGEHLVALKEADEALIAAEEQHRGILEETHRRSEAILAEANEKHEKVLAELRQAHEQDRETLLKDHELLVQEVAAYKSAMDEYLVDREQTRERHEEEIVQRDINITSLREDLESEKEQHAKLAASMEALKNELEATRSRTSELVEEVSKRETLANDLDRHRSLLGEVQNDLQKTRDERDNLAAEKIRQEESLRQLQAQLEAQSSAVKANDVLASPTRPTLERSAISRLNGIPPAKAPPLSPPPVGPPPPTPGSLPRLPNDAGPSRSSATVSTSSRTSHTDSPAISTPATSLSSVPPAINGHAPVETKASAMIEEQARQIEEQETMIKTLTKQLTHCEGDLQAHMDLVATLQTQLNDSDRNLRKSRVQATEISKDRDRLSGQVDTLRNDLQEAKREVVSVRRSIVEEKQSLEHRLDEERKAKERARAQLDSRMEEIQKRKSKFVCM